MKIDSYTAAERERLKAEINKSINADLDRLLISFITVFLAAMLILISLKLGEANRTLNDLREQISTMEAANDEQT